MLGMCVWGHFGESSSESLIRGLGTGLEPIPPSFPRMQWIPGLQRTCHVARRMRPFLRSIPERATSNPGSAVHECACGLGFGVCATSDKSCIGLHLSLGKKMII